VQQSIFTTDSATVYIVLLKTVQQSISTTNSAAVYVVPLQTVQRSISHLSLSSICLWKTCVIKNYLNTHCSLIILMEGKVYLTFHPPRSKYPCYWSVQKQALVRVEKQGRNFFYKGNMNVGYPGNDRPQWWYEKWNVSDSKKKVEKAIADGWSSKRK